MTDLTTITTPFGLLDDATQKALKEHGGPYERFNQYGEWEDRSEEIGRWLYATVYRVRPEPTRPLVVRDWSVFADWVRFVARDSNGTVWAYEKYPIEREDHWAFENGEAQSLNLLSPTIIDPGTCDWREAICERPDEGEVETKTAWLKEHGNEVPSLWNYPDIDRTRGRYSITHRDGKPTRLVWEADQ